MRTALLVAALFGSLACEQQGRNTRKQRDQACTRNLECAYGLECADATTLVDGGPAAAAKTCQLKSFGDCEGDGNANPTQPQCLSGTRCKDNHCVVQCVAKADCKEGEVCRVGVCVKGGNANAQCYDNRDCAWPETCFYGQCVTRTEAMRCNSDLDCGQTFRCINGLCQ